ncbi:hypothetical protein Plo01_66790 [Planobispora longispora]|uniref:Uncharacterized protein n=1 Tax=Planobispora longispora TaxID=28887 RepID=A0A8J3RS24_9ACTN|nr:hypothetical protein Plo01_66790 [Planobispora longispora]
MNRAHRRRGRAARGAASGAAGATAPGTAGAVVRAAGSDAAGDSGRGSAGSAVEDVVWTVSGVRVAVMAQTLPSRRPGANGHRRRGPKTWHPCLSDMESSA